MDIGIDHNLNQWSTATVHETHGARGPVGSTENDTMAAGKKPHLTSDFLTGMGGGRDLDGANSSRAGETDHGFAPPTGGGRDCGGARDCPT
jgi:hypothetical protein